MKFKDIILQNLDKLDEIDIHSKISEILGYNRGMDLTRVDHTIKKLLKLHNGSIIGAINYYRLAYPNSTLKNANDYCNCVRDSMLLTGELKINIESIELQSLNAETLFLELIKFNQFNNCIYYDIYDEWIIKLGLVDGLVWVNYHRIWLKFKKIFNTDKEISQFLSKMMLKHFKIDNVHVVSCYKI